MVFVSVFILTGCGSSDKEKDKETDKKEKITYETPIEYYFRGIEKRNYSTTMKAFPKKYKGTFTEVEFNNFVDSLEEEYGTYTFDFKITYKNDLSQSKIDEYNEYFQEKYNSDIKVTEGYEMRAKLTIKGSKKDDEEDISLDVAKIGDEWYILDD